MGYHGAGTDQRAFSNGHPGENHRAAPDRGTAFHPRGNDVPILFGLQTTIGGRPWVKIVDEHHSVSHEHVILDRDSFADESVRGNLAPASNECLFLNLDEGSNLGVIPQRAAVEIHQVRLENPDSLSQNNVGGNWHKDYCIRRCLFNGKDGIDVLVTTMSDGMTVRAERQALCRAETPAPLFRHPVHLIAETM